MFALLAEGFLSTPFAAAGSVGSSGTAVGVAGSALGLLLALRLLLALWAPISFWVTPSALVPTSAFCGAAVQARPRRLTKNRRLQAPTSPYCYWSLDVRALTCF